MKFFGIAAFLALAGSAVHGAALYGRQGVPIHYYPPRSSHVQYVPFGRDGAQPETTAPTTTPPPPPSGEYSFSYNIEAQDGKQSRQESADVNGNVMGQYAFTLNDGRQRTVQYTAGEEGFKAKIQSNEQGIDLDQAPADVTYVQKSNGQLPAQTRFQHAHAWVVAPQHGNYHKGYPVHRVPYGRPSW